MEIFVMVKEGTVHRDSLLHLSLQ